MGLGKAWDVDENGILARAWRSPSEDLVAGAEQKAKVFFDTMFRRFVEKDPAAGAVIEAKYEYCSPESFRKHVTDLSADAQKISVALGKVRAFKPSGVGEDDIVSMAAEIHMGKASTMDYALKEYCKENWLGFKS